MNKNTNQRLALKFLHHLNLKKSNQGFTLIELLVVVIIIGVLAAVALPNLLGQVAKGRQAEAKNNLGTINRAQQAYRLEELTFSTETDLPVKLSWQYYEIAYWNPDNQVQEPAKEFADYGVKAKEQYQDDILDYVGVVSQLEGKFSQVICEEKSLNSNNNNDPNFATLNADADGVECDTSISKPVK